MSSTMEIPDLPLNIRENISDGCLGYIDELHHRSWQVAIQGLESIQVDPKEYPYHNREHSELVTRNWAKYALVGIGTLMTVVKYCTGIAASGTHDWPYDKKLAGTGENEANASIFAKSLMSQYDIFQPSHIEFVKQLHSASIFKTADSKGIHQCARNRFYEEKLFVDIDVCYIGDEWDIAKKGIDAYYAETTGRENDLSDPDYIKYLKFEAIMLKGQNFKTEIIRQEFPHTNDNADRIQKIVDEV